jgi:hypothetical protein
MSFQIFLTGVQAHRCMSTTHTHRAFHLTGIVLSTQSYDLNHIMVHTHLLLTIVTVSCMESALFIHDLISEQKDCSLAVFKPLRSKPPESIEI